MSALGKHQRPLTNAKWLNPDRPHHRENRNLHVENELLRQELASLEQRASGDEAGQIARAVFLFDHFERAVSGSQTFRALFDEEKHQELAAAFVHAINGHHDLHPLCPTCEEPRCGGCLHRGLSPMTERDDQYALDESLEELERSLR